MNNSFAAEALENMRDTHRVVPLSAYDVNGDLIAPHEYKLRLQGALVIVRFNMLHWSIGARKDQGPVDTYVAEIQGIRVLDPPKLQAHQTPKKKRVRKKDPFDDGKSTKSSINPSV
jgi:hypothetical protein